MRPKKKLTKYAQALKTLVGVLGACDDKIAIESVNPRSVKDALERFEDDHVWWFYNALLDNDLIDDPYINIEDGVKYSYVFKSFDVDGIHRLTRKLRQIRISKRAA